MITLVYLSCEFLIGDLCILQTSFLRSLAPRVRQKGGLFWGQVGLRSPG